MTLPVTVLPDPELVAVHWAKADPDLAALLTGRVSTALPRPSRLVFPWLRVFTVSGAPPVTEPPVSQTVLQWDAFAESGGDDKTPPDWATASLVARTLAAKVKLFDGYLGFDQPRRVTFGGEEAIIDGFTVTFGPVRQPEPETGWARYRVDTVLRCRNG